VNNKGGDWKVNFKKIREKVYEEYKKNGYEDMWGFPNYEQQKRHQALASCYLELKEITDHMENVRKGEPVKVDSFLKNFPNWDMAKISSAAEALLITTEITELTESLLVADKENVKEEMADIFIRLANMSTRLGINLEEAILRKHEKNMDREKLHGKVV
jgi:NTP pyrophosphatase (non-canonical NTP hydrolase)